MFGFQSADFIKARPQWLDAGYMTAFLSFAAKCFDTWGGSIHDASANPSLRGVFDVAIHFFFRKFEMLSRMECFMNPNLRWSNNARCNRTSQKTMAAPMESRHCSVFAERRYFFWKTPLITASMRRFSARPASVSLVAMGLASPKPTAVSREASMPKLAMRYSRTLFARRSDSFWL